MKKKIIISFGIIIVVAVIVFLNVGPLMEIYFDKTEGLVEFKVEGNKAYMNGLISKRTISRVEDLIKNYPEVDTIVMKNVPGSIDDESNLIASRLVRKAGLNIVVEEDSYIASGGVDFFCAGAKRTAHEEAFIGVHSWAAVGVDDASKLPKDDPEHKKYLDYYNEMGIPEAFYWFTIQSAPADGIYNMTQDERYKYGLIED